MSDDLSAQRREKLRALVGPGRSAYPARFPVTHTAGRIREEHGRLAPGTETQARVAVAGRLMTLRTMGKAAFGHLQDGTDKIQVYFRSDALGEGYGRLAHLDLGDILGAEGTVMMTKTGELSVRVSSWALLAKGLRPMPEKWHGLKDVEARYRQRYLDLIANESSRTTFTRRRALVRGLRAAFESRGFTEVETPMLQPRAGGAAAKPFVTHHEVLDQDLYLRIAPELYLKRLVVGGIDRVFEIGRNFRNEGVSTRHNPEFTMLEAYQAYANYADIMDLAEAVVSDSLAAALAGAPCEFAGKGVSLARPWRRANLYDLLREATGMDLRPVRDAAGLRAAAAKLGIPVRPEAGPWKILDRIFEEKVQPSLWAPTFVTDFPAESSPLAKRRADAPDIAERFELFIAGLEVGNAYSEQNDPDEQRRRFEEQARLRQAGDAEAQVLDEDYLTALEYGLPPCGGLGLGVDRLAMIAAGMESIREVILFPALKTGET